MSDFRQIRRVISLLWMLLFTVALHASPKLVWNSNTEEDLAGYRVYISDANATYPPIEIKDLSAFHSLTNLDAETTYWVYVTAFNTNNFESAPSKVLQFPDSPGCNYSLHPNKDFLSPWPQLGKFRVTAASRCVWSAVALDDWIQIASTSNGEGMSEVYYEVKQNTQPFPRQGTIRVADQLFTVNQTAAGISPTITTFLPAAVNVKEGERLELSIEATDESELRYRWYQNGVLVPNATNSYLIVKNVSPDDEGKYTVEVASAVRTLMDGPAEVSVYAKPRIKENGQPKSLGVVLGEAAFLTVDATGPDLHYQWYKDGNPLPATAPFLYFPALSTNDFGSYQVRISNVAGAIGSLPAFIFPATPEQLAGRIEIQKAALDDVRIQANGLPGDQYEIQASTDLANWFLIQTVEADLTGRFVITVPTPLTADRWFIRTVRQRQQ